jgi:hypothetical protein
VYNIFFYRLAVSEAPSELEACELVAHCLQHAAGKKTVFQALRWVEFAAMMVHIRFISTRCDTLRDIRMDHLDCIDDATSPLGVTLRDYIPKAKQDILGTNGGALLRDYPNLFNRCVHHITPCQQSMRRVSAHLTAGTYAPSLF